MKKSTLLCISIFSLIIICSALALSSCSTIFNGSKQEVRIDCLTSEAEVYVNGTRIGLAPQSVKLKRGEKHLIEVTKDGYETYRFSTSKTLAGWFWGNLLCGGVIGMVIDLATGNAYNIDPDYIKADLKKLTSSLNNDGNNSYVFVKNQNGTYSIALNIVWE